MNPSIAFLLLAASLPPALSAQPGLQKQITKIASDAQGKVSVSCLLPGTPLACDLNPRAHPPMQSVFKFPLVLTVLHAVETGAFTLDQPIRFRASDRILPQTYSPLQDKYPNAEVDVPLRELLQLAVGLSDNAAAEVLLRIAGGPKGVDDYIHSLGVSGFHLQDGEATMHRDVSAQYRNWWEPAAAVRLLRLLSDHSPLSADHTRLLLGWMTATPTGAKRIKANLPDGTAVAHKTGTSGTDKGLNHATNDVGLVKLPDGRELAIAVFITDSTADEPARESVIARIAQAIYESAIGAAK